jgi:phosphatidylglycerol:prolipoprotein diacylglycerol transferase
VLALRWYGLMYVIAFVFGYFVFRWLQKTGYLRIKAEDVTNLIVVGVLGTFLGGRLGYLLFYQFDKLFGDKGDMTGSEKIGMVFKVWEGGMSFHGVVIGVGLAVLIYAYIKKKNFWNILDGAVHIVPLGVAMVRVGNFINGELYGRIITDEAGKAIKDPDKLPWYAMKFPTENDDVLAVSRMQDALRADYLAEHPAATEIPATAMHPLPVKPEIWEQVAQFFPGRWPSQIVQVALEGMAVLFAIWILRRFVKRPGQLSSVFLMLYAICRIPAEMIRQPDTQVDPNNPTIGATASFLASIDLTMGQLLSVGIFVYGLAQFLITQWKPVTGREYTVDERRGGFFKDTLRDMPEILGLRKKPKVVEAAKEETPEPPISEEPRPE